MTMQELQRQLDMLRAENAKLQAAATSRVKVGLTKNGTVAVLGLRRFPIACWPNEWQVIAQAMPTILECCKRAPGASGT